MKHLGLYITFFILIIFFCAKKPKHNTSENEVIKSEYTQKKDSSINKNKKESSLKINKIQQLKLPRKFDSVPGGNDVYRSNQPTLSQLKVILETYNINTVIRMNDTEGTGVSPSSEKKLVESLGKKYIWINAHMGYEKGKGYIESIDTVQPYLKEGKVLIHCTAGADRTGYQVGRYIKDVLNWKSIDIWNYTIKYNNWERYICEKRMGYIKYMEAFYTLDDWCLEFGKQCKSCF